MRKFILLFTIVFIVAMLVCFSVAPVALAADGDALVEGWGSQAKAPTMADRFKEWWGNFANKELTVFGISFTVQAAIFFAIGIVAKKVKNRLSSDKRETQAYLDKIRAEYATVMSELDRAHETYLKIEKNAKVDEIIQNLTEQAEPAKAEETPAPAEDEPVEEEPSEDPSPSAVSRPIV